MHRSGQLKLRMVLERVESTTVARSKQNVCNNVSKIKVYLLEFYLKTNFAEMKSLAQKALL